MYNIDGDFGKVRLTQCSITHLNEEYFICIVLCGWHHCNDKYCINRLYNADDDTNLVIYTVSGQGTLEMEGVIYGLTPETAIIIKAGTPVRYYTPKNKMWEFYWIHFKGRACQPLVEFFCRQKKKLIYLNNYNEIKALVEYALIGTKGEHIQSVIEVSSRLSKILYGMIVAQDIRCFPDYYDNISNHAIDFIQQNYQNSIGIKEISRNLYISDEHFIRVFKAEKGKSPYRYLLEFRIEKSKSLLSNTNISIEEIAHMVGFPNHSNFSKQFKTVIGVSPMNFRIGNPHYTYQNLFQL